MLLVGNGGTLPTGNTVVKRGGTASLLRKRNVRSTCRHHAAPRSNPAGSEGFVSSPRHPRRRRRDHRRGGRHQQNDALPAFRFEGRPHRCLFARRCGRGRRDVAGFRTRASRRHASPVEGMAGLRGRMCDLRRAGLRPCQCRRRTDLGRSSRPSNHRTIEDRAPQPPRLALQPCRHLAVRSAGGHADAAARGRSSPRRRKP